MTEAPSQPSDDPTTNADEIVASMSDAGVAALFFTSGSDIAFYQEAICKRLAQGKEAPRLISITHELVNINAAMGYAAVSGRPVACAVHIDIGTLNFGAGLHNASRARLPLLLTAGTPATADVGSMPGARDGGHHWAQQTADQNGIARPHVKWDHRLELQDNAWNVVGRAVQVATATPCGPAYLSIPREVAMAPSRLTPASRLAYARRGATLPGAPDEESVAGIYRALTRARRVVVITGRGGVDPASCAELVRFADRFGAVVTDGCKPTSSYQCISYDHALYSPRRVLGDADLVLVLECEVPWITGVDDPPADATVIVVDADPVAARVTLLDLPASRRLVSDTSRFCRALLAWADAHDARDAAETFGRRRDAAIAAVARWRAEDRALPESRRRTDLIDPDWAAMAVSDALPEDAIVFDDTVYSAPVRRYSRLRGPAQYFCNNTTAGGWGVGAALGGALAQSQRPVVSVIGDGFWTYGVPTSALWVARACGAPFLGIVFQNNSYNTGTEEVDRLHPTGYARRAGFPGGYFPQPVDFALEAAATGAWGMNVTRATDLAGAIANGIDRVRNGQAAVIAIQLPRLATKF